MRASVAISRCQQEPKLLLFTPPQSFLSTCTPPKWLNHFQEYSHGLDKKEGKRMNKRYLLAERTPFENDSPKPYQQFCLCLIG